MNNLLRKVVLVLLVSILIAGGGRVTQLWAQPAAAPPAANLGGFAAVPAQDLTPDDSVCRWSAPACPAGCGGGEGEAYVDPGDTIDDAVVAELVGDSPAFSHDGLLVATVEVATSGSDTVHIWQSDDGSPVQDLDGSAFVFSPGTDIIAVNQEDGWHLWDTTSWEELGWHADPDVQLYFSDSGNSVVTQAVAQDTKLATVKIYDLPSDTEFPAIADVKLPTAISSDGTQLATTRPQNSGSLDYDSIVLWDTAAGTELQEMGPEIQSQLPLAGLRGHRHVSTLAFSPDGSALLSAGHDAVRLWDTTSGTHLRCLETPDQLGALSAAWGADANTIITKPAASSDCICGYLGEQNVYVWDAGTNHPTGIIDLGEPTGTAEIGLSPETTDGKVLVWRGYNALDKLKDRKVFVWDLASQKLESVLPTKGNVTQAAISPSGDRAVTVAYYGGGTNDAEGKTWDTQLWDTTSRSLAKTAAAQTSYWDALKAELDGKPASAQQRSLRRAKSLSPEMFSSVTEISEDDAAAYGASLERADQVNALADTAGSAAAAFDAEIRATAPKWSELSNEDLATEVAAYIDFWFDYNPEGFAGLANAYQEFAKLEPAAAAALAKVHGLDKAQGMATNSPVDAQIFCALALNLPEWKKAAALCQEVDVTVAPIALDDIVEGSVTTEKVSIWSIDISEAMDLVVSMQVTGSEWYPHLYVVGPDGTIISDGGRSDGTGTFIQAALPKAGTYLIAAVGDSDSGGDYVLNVYDAAAAQG